MLLYLHMEMNGFSPGDVLEAADVYVRCGQLIFQYTFVFITIKVVGFSSAQRKTINDVL